METKNVLVVLAGALVLSLIVSLAVVGGFKGTGYAVGDTVKVRVAEGKSGTFSLGGVKHTITVSKTFRYQQYPSANVIVDGDTTYGIQVGGSISTPSNLKVTVDKITSFFRRDYVSFTVTEVQDCEPSNGYCANALDCIDAGGNALDYDCTFGLDCCSINPEKSCSDLGGDICFADEACSGDETYNSVDQKFCCLNGGTCTPFPVPSEEFITEVELYSILSNSFGIIRNEVGLSCRDACNDYHTYEGDAGATCMAGFEFDRVGRVIKDTLSCNFNPDEQFINSSRSLSCLCTSKS